MTQGGAHESGWGRAGMTVHRTQENGETFCGEETSTVGDRESSLDAVRNHGASLCAICDRFAQGH